MVSKIEAKHYFSGGNILGEDFLLQVQDGASMDTKLVRYRLVNENTLEYISSRELQIKGMGESGYVQVIDSTRFAFVSSFCNHMYLADYSKKVLLPARTIDTASSIPPTIIIPGKDILTFAAQPRLINNTIFNDKNYLYVHSLVSSNNDDPDILREKTILDKYDLMSGVYRETIYAPSSFNKIVDDVFVKDDITYELYGGTLLIYESTK